MKRIIPIAIAGMKTFLRKGLIAGVFIAVLSPAPAAFSCTPTTTSSHIDPVKRKRWVVKRMRHLKHEQDIDQAIIVLDGDIKPRGKSGGNAA